MDDRPPTEIRPVQLHDRILLLGTERGVEPPLSIDRDSFFNEGAGVGNGGGRSAISTYLSLKFQI